MIRYRFCCGTGFFSNHSSKTCPGQNWYRNVRGVTLLELILVLVIIAIGASLAVPKLRRSVENREAKAALETLRSISHAVRMYEVTKGSLPADLHTLETETTDQAGTVTSYGIFYLNSREYAPGYDFCIDKSISPARMIAEAQNYDRIITLAQSAVKGQDGEVTDSAGFLGPSSAQAVCRPPFVPPPRPRP
jgi:prepilin-type N-terminal cleavage/methylation domain-containing protein